jgi:glyoxylase I family protein
MVKNIHHAGVIVEDMARSLAFYQTTLGATVGLDLMMDLPTFGQGVGIAGATARIVFLQFPELSASLELIQYLSPAGKRVVSEPMPNGIGGNAHVAFRVDDIFAVHKSFTEKGVRFVTAPAVFPPDHPQLGGVKFCYFRDPDGALLELIEVPQ